MNNVMWNPEEKQIQSSQMIDFMEFVNTRFQLSIKNYEELYAWSINEGESFWECFWIYSKIIHHSPFHDVVDDINQMPGAKWFEGATLNFSEK